MAWPSRECGPDTLGWAGPVGASIAGRTSRGSLVHHRPTRRMTSRQTTESYMIYRDWTSLCKHIRSQQAIQIVQIPKILKTFDQVQLLDLLAMIQRKGDTPDMPSSLAMVSSSRAVVRKSPSPWPDHSGHGRLSDRSRTPVRRARATSRWGCDDECYSFEDSECTSRSRSSHSLRSPDLHPDSPVDFLSAIQPEEMTMTTSLSDSEDEDRSSKKVSLAQYEIFRQAVTSSKGSYKIVPAKTKRAIRASRLDLGDDEKTDQLLWLDQPSLLDTMALTARITQGLKDEEPVEKTTLSEALNTESLTFKHLTVKQVLPREPYSLKMHKDAQYQTKPPTEDGFGDWKPPANYQISHKMAMDTEELSRRSGIYASLAYSMVASVMSELSPRDERSKLLKEKLAIIQEAQVVAMSSGFAAASNLQLLLRDALL